MDWELFVDESGTFDKDERCLIGGFICPKGSVTSHTVLNWKSEIISNPTVEEKIQKLGCWYYDHCRENTYADKKKKVLRGKLQADIVEEYAKKIQGVGGKIIIFDNYSGSYNIDNTTNFLTVLAKGLMMLFYDLQGDATSIMLHFASRRNNTRQDNPEQLLISPTKVQAEGRTDRGVILAPQYANQIRNLAFLQGGQWLLENRVFSDMISTIDVIEDIHINQDAKGHYNKQSNPLTVPCDYICNTLITADGYDAIHQKRVANIYASVAVTYYRVDRPLQFGLNGLDAWEDENDNGKILFTLISMDFPEPLTAQFFNHFNQATLETKKTAIKYVVKALYEKVESQKCMELLVERLDHTVASAEGIDHLEIRNEFVANILLYEESLYTHLGEQGKVDEIRQMFYKVIDCIEDDAVRDELLDIAENRHLIDLTDRFAYREAIAEFEQIEVYWKQRISLRQKRLLLADEPPRYPAYGKTIGSFLQTIRHVLHSVTGDEKELYYIEATDRYKDGRYHLIKPYDISRYYQTCCDIEAEMYYFQSAFTNLYYAVLVAEETDMNLEKNIEFSSEAASTILKHSGFNGENNPYMLQHYVRLLSIMYQVNKNSKEAEIILQPFVPSFKLNIVDDIRNPHPKTQIQWKTASLIAYRQASTPDERKLSSQLFEIAARNLLSYETTIFSAISVAIRAEQLFHILSLHIPGNEMKVRKFLQDAYDQFLNLKEEGTIDPFSNLIPDKIISKDIDTATLNKIVSLIGY